MRWWLWFLLPSSVWARPGDLDDPLQVQQTPFVHAASTVGRSSQVVRYACAAQLDESGPEVLYRFEAPQNGWLAAFVEGDADPIDVDVHVLPSLTGQDGALPCLARGNRGAEARVTPGTYFVAVDTYENASRAGPYTLRIDFHPEDDWYERDLARGVRLRTKRYPALFDSVQTASVLEVRLNEPGVIVKPIDGSGCARTSALGRNAGAVAAINGGFFGGGCGSVSLLKVDGQLLATNAVARTAFGLDAQNQPMLALVAAGRDWPEAAQALGGVPRIVVNGQVDVRVAEEGSTNDFSMTRHPRTAVGITAEGNLLLATIDGRTSAGAGMRLPELAQWMIWLGAAEALNLDGGGSTTLWTASEPFDGIVNFPSDNGAADHLGERAVANALGVWGTTIDREPLWLNAPSPTEVHVGEQWRQELVVADPEGARATFSVEASLNGQVELTDRGDGTALLLITPATEDARLSPATITVIARLSAGAPGQWQTQLQIIDDNALDAGVTDGGSADLAMAADAATHDAEAPATDAANDAPLPNSKRGCSCSSHTNPSALLAFGWGLILLCPKRLRRRHDA